MWIRSSWYGILIDPRWPVPGNCDSPCYWFPRSDHFQPCSPPVIDSLTHFDSSVMQIQQQCWDGCRRHKWSVLSGRYWFHLIISLTTAHSRINYFRRSNPRAHKSGNRANTVLQSITDHCFQGGWAAPYRLLLRWRDKEMRWVSRVVLVDRRERSRWLAE